MSKEFAEAALGTFAEAVNTGKFDLFDQVVASNCVDHDPADGQVPGPSGYRMFFSGMRTAFPDMSVTPQTIIQDEDTIAFAYTITGAHTGPFTKIAYRQEGQNPWNADLQIQRWQDGRALGKLRRVRPPKADWRNPRLRSLCL
jgi:predicted ester cyclase